MGIPAFESGSRFTYGDYLQWEGEDRYELFDGVPVLMTPSPGSRHQSIVGSLFAEIRALIRSAGSSCRVFIAPFDVVLPLSDEAAKDAKNVVQPDVLLVCDADKITPQSCVGAPDLVVEVLSPSTAIKDQKVKYELYQKAGVPEYWIVDPSGAYLVRYVLNSTGRYEREGVYGRDDSLPVSALGNLRIDLKAVFEEEV